MSVDRLASGAGEWLSGAGPMSDIVISTRIRLARNVAGHPFLSKCSETQRREIHRLLSEKIAETEFGRNSIFVDIDDTDEIDRLVLVERHLISRQQAEGHGSRGLAVSPLETVAMMINEEDHLRIQALRSGLQLEELWTEINAIDDAIEKKVHYAFHNKLGFLTACPTNVGTGIRVSAMLHLPALKITGEIEMAFRAIRDMRLAVRGLHGEGTEAVGDFYQVSNQTTLGKSEEEIISDFRQTIVPRLVEYERRARQTLIKDKAVILDDKVYRAFGILENARSISSEETMFLLSHIRMGINLGRLRNIDLSTVNDLFLLTQPGHLQKRYGCLDDEARSIARAEFTRQKLTDSNN